MKRLRQLIPSVPSAVVRRAGRAAVVVPGTFAIAEKLLHNPTAALFASFGSVTMLLFVDFGGPRLARFQSECALALACLVLVTAGTACSRTAWLGVVVTLTVSFAILFAGIISSVLASATTSLLISLVLPISLPGPISSIPDRLLGWVLAAVASLAAIMLWPGPNVEPLLTQTARATATLGRDVHRLARAGGDPAARTVAFSDSVRAITELRHSFLGAPNRPASLSLGTRMLIQAVEQLILLGQAIERIATEMEPAEPPVARVLSAAGTVLVHSAELLASTDADPSQLDAELAEVRSACAAVLGAPSSAPADDDGSIPNPAAAGLHRWTHQFHAQEVATSAAAVVGFLRQTIAARRRGWWARLLGRELPGPASSLSAARERIGAHVERHSVWLHNSIRGAMGLAVAVLAADLTGVQHGFWVVFGTLAVLRSNAVDTGRNALGAMAGTVVGIIVGGVIVALIGSNIVLSWILLPVAVAFTAVAPAAISFAAGQAGFTITLLFLFDIITPVGWSTGVIRFEDMALGCATGVVVSALLWPRGASVVLRRELAEAFDSTLDYVTQATRVALARCDSTAAACPEPLVQRARATNAARRLDDAFRQYLAERGTKRVPLEDVTALVIAVATLRHTADEISALWSDEVAPRGADRSVARLQIMESATRLADWYERASNTLLHPRDSLDPVIADNGAGDRLLSLLAWDFFSPEEATARGAVKLVWTFEHLEALRHLQAVLRPAFSAAASSPAGKARFAASRT